MKLKGFIAASVYLLLTACSSRTENTSFFNYRASLPASKAFSQLGLKLITVYIHNKDETISALYGNDLALKQMIGSTKEVKPCEVLTLVTWRQQADDHWFGGKIPGVLQSIEVIKIDKKNRLKVNYLHYEGANLILRTDTTNNYNRINYLFNLRPSVLP